MYGRWTAAIRAAAQDLTASEAPLAPSQTPPDSFSGADASAPPHPVPADSPSRWPAALTRMWRSIFAREAFAHRAHDAESAPGGASFFPRRGAKPDKSDLPRA